MRNPQFSWATCSRVKHPHSEEFPPNVHSKSIPFHPCPMSPCKKAPLQFSCRPLYVVEGVLRSFQSLLFSRLKNLSSHPVFTRDMLQPLDLLCDPCLDSPQQVHIILILGPQSWMQYSRGLSQNQNVPVL